MPLQPRELRLADAPPPERADAARNRHAVLAAALRMVDQCGVDVVSMDAVAAEAGVGKGTLFRRFGSREGLMAAVLNESETRGRPPSCPAHHRWDRGRRRWSGCWSSGTPGCTST